MIKALIVIVLLLVQISYAHADFQSDRKWVETHPDYFPIKLLYLGKKPTNTCLGSSVEACMEKLGAPGKRQFVSADEEHLFYYGKKIFYSGTRKKNAAIGPEWREIVVKSGKVVDEFEVVQVIETISAFFPYAEGQHYYEEYGSNKTESETVPIYGAMPDIPVTEVQQMLKSNRREELHTVIFTLLIKRLCDADIKDFKKESAFAYEKWRNDHSALVKAIEEDIEFKGYIEFMLKIIKSDPGLAGEAFPALSTCGAPAFYRSKQFSGSVVDAETGKPIEGVVVVAQWIPRSWKRGEMGYYGLVEIYEAVTDKDGKYTIPGWGPKLREPGTYLDDGEPEISFFKKGYWYQHVANEGKSGNSSLRESVWGGKVVKMKKFVFGEEIKYTDANGKPATSKATEENLDSMLGRVDTDIFSAIEDPRESGGMPVRRIKHMAKEWSEINKALKKPRSLSNVLEKMLKEEFKNE